MAYYWVNIWFSCRHITLHNIHILDHVDVTKVFSILDARSGHWNIVIDKESSLWSTFKTHELCPRCLLKEDRRHI